MSTTYIPANIGGLTKDRVRWRVGDVNGNPQWFLQDEEINALLATQVYPDGSIQFDEVCALCAENIGAQCTQLANSIAQRNLKVVYGDRAKAAFVLADRIRDKAMMWPGGPTEYGALSGQICHGGLPPQYDQLAGICPERIESPFDIPPY